MSIDHLEQILEGGVMQRDRGVSHSNSKILIVLTNLSLIKFRIHPHFELLNKI